MLQPLFAAALKAGVERLLNAPGHAEIPDCPEYPSQYEGVCARFGRAVHVGTLAPANPERYINFGMSGWTVEILSATVAAEIEALSADTRTRLARTVALIQTQGLERIGMPHVKHIEGKLWEIRVKGRDGIARAFYVTASGRRVVIVRAFVKKTQKTPRREIDLALQRAQEVA